MPGVITKESAKASGYEQFALLVSGGTRLRLGVVRAWVKAEGGPITNPLNIGPGRNYGSPAGAARATVSLINTASFYKGIRAAALTGDGDKQIAAIKASPWDASHYSNGVLDRTWQEEKSRGGVGDIPVIGSAVGAVTGVASATEAAAGAIASVAGALVNPDFWLRVVQVLGGGILIVLGALMLSKEYVPAPVKKAAKVAVLRKA